MNALFLFFVLTEVVGAVSIVAFKVLNDRMEDYVHLDILGIGIVALVLGALAAVVLFGIAALIIEVVVLGIMVGAVAVSDIFA